MTLDSPSWVSGNLGLGGNLTVLTVNDSLDIGGMFDWSTTATLAGAGATEANGAEAATALSCREGSSAPGDQDRKGPDLHQRDALGADRDGWRGARCDAAR